MFLDLFLIFAKIGLFTFGGGYAMISVIEDICVEKKQWITHDDMMNVTIIAESTPGPIAINCASFVGYKKAGFLGAVVATLGIVLPSFVIIYVISMFLDYFLEIGIIASAFKGIKLAVGILILDAGLKMTRKMKGKRFPQAIMGGSFLIMLLMNLFSGKFSSIALMTITGVISLTIYLLGNKWIQKGGEGQ